MRPPLIADALITAVCVLSLLILGGCADGGPGCADGHKAARAYSHLPGHDDSRTLSNRDLAAIWKDIAKHMSASASAIAESRPGLASSVQAGADAARTIGMEFEGGNPNVGRLTTRAFDAGLGAVDAAC
jgi:hypothetical protein